MSAIFGIPPNRVRINYKAHPGQVEISDAIAANFCSSNPAGIIEVICSRGWGKTLWAVCEVLIPFLEQNPSAQVMWVAPTSSTTMTPIDDVFRGVNELTGERWVPEFDEEGRRVWEFITTRSGPILKWHNGATVSFKSAAAPDSIVSKGFNRIIMDEAALTPQQVFDLQIVGTARKAGIKIFLITTPRGKKHWTYNVFMKGQDKSNPLYLSFQQDFTKNPYFSETQKEIMKNLPDWIVRQEYYAEFLADGDNVIKGLEGVLFGEEVNFQSTQQEWSLPITDAEIKNLNGTVTKRRAEDRQFIAGMDIAKSVDYTVIWVMDMETGELVYYRRLNKMDYRDVLKIVTEVCKKYNHAELVFDATGVGQGLGDVLNDHEVISHPFVFTNESKNELVNKLILAIEYNEIKIPNIVTVKKELSVFTYTMTRTGKISYGAPHGEHDDIVMALALANWGRKENTVTDNVGVLDELVQWNSGPSEGHRSILEEMYDDND